MLINYLLRFALRAFGRTRTLCAHLFMSNLKEELAESIKCPHLFRTPQIKGGRKAASALKIRYMRIDSLEVCRKLLSHHSSSISIIMN